MGIAVGGTTVLVRTGVTDAATLDASEIEPDYVLDSIAEIGAVLGSEGDE
jgi:4-nitrophenyl phosphatase